MSVSLARLWRRLWSGARVPITSVDTGKIIDRLGEADTTDWMPSSRPSPPFRLDVCFAAPCYVPGWMLQNASCKTAPVAPTPLANDVGYVLSEAAIGHEAALAEHYRRILVAAPDWRRWRDAHRGCFEVDLVIRIEGEHDLQLEMFGGAALAAAELLILLADSDAPPDTLYDNLDQGWALRMVATPDAIFTREWDWERPAAEDKPRALSFPRRELAAQAANALEQLRQVHGALVRDIGTDLWNQPRPSDGKGARSS
jgi:hypothetical protein